jgi:predicted O-methyltransferase YrrM
MSVTSLEALKAELERFGAENDRANSDRSRCMLNITRDTGECLSVLIRATAARTILEIGTSNGYSTLWLAEAASVTGGSVTTVEFDENKLALASANFGRSGLASNIKLVHGDAEHVLRQTKDEAYDFIFLDADRSSYVGWWTHLRRVLRQGGLMVVDNATSHREQLEPLVNVVRADPAFVTSVVPVGNGELLAVKGPQP